MSRLNFVVASTPRSGTNYTAEIFRAAGIPCGHERYFGATSQSFAAPSSSVFGDASWMVAPFIHQLPHDTIILHQLRHPIQTLNSMINMGHFLLSSVANEYVAFIKRHVTFPSSCTNQQDLAMFFWCYWHKLIEVQSEGRTYVRYRIEDTSTDQLLSLVARYPKKHRGDPGTIVSSTCNNRGNWHSFVTRESLTDEVRSLALRYGYSV